FPSTPNRADRLPKWPEWHRIGHIQRAIRRSFIASYGAPRTTTQLAARAYCRQKTPLQSWQYRSVRKAASRWAVPVGLAKGRRGLAILWRPKPEFAKQFE